MYETSATTEGVTPETWRLRWDIVKQRCDELGATTDPMRAERLGISRATLDRWRKGTVQPNFVRAKQAADALGLANDAIWERVSA